MITVGPLPQLQPDWLRTSAEYQFAVRAGVVREVAGPGAVWRGKIDVESFNVGK
jgi:hypothetical protein